MKIHGIRSLALLAFALLPSTVRAQVVSLDTMQVTVASRLPAGASLRAVDVIDRKMIEHLPTLTLADAIARALGADVQQRSPAQADMALRGSTTEQILILIDGVPVNDTQTGHFHLDQAVPLDAVERIEVLRGAASSVYGTNAVGGIVNIVTRRDRRSIDLRAEGGSFGTAALAARIGGRLRDVAPATFSIEHDLSDGHRAGTDYRVTIARGTLDLPAGGGVIRMDAGDSRRAYGASQFYAPFPTAYEETRTLTGGVSYLRAFGNVSIEPRATIRRHHDDFVLRKEDPSFYHNVHHATDAGGGMVVRAPIGPVRSAFGGETFHSSIASTNLGNHDESRGALFGEATAGRVTGILGSAGLRYDHSSTFGDFVSPSAAASLQVTNELRVRAAVARGFRAPTWTDRYYSDPANRGDSTLRVERAWSYEAGVAAAPLSALSVDLTGFVRRVDNAIDWVKPAGAPASTPFQIVNIARATFRGAELRIDRPGLFGVDWTLRASALTFDADSVAGLQSKYALRPVTETASLQLDVPLPFRSRFAVTGRHQRRPGAAGYEIVDARLSTHWRGFEAFLSGTNLTDTRYLDVSAVTAPGRALMAGIRMGAPTD